MSKALAVTKSEPQNRTLLFSVACSALDSFLFGFDTAVIAGATGSLREVFELSCGWAAPAVVRGD